MRLSPSFLSLSLCASSSLRWLFNVGFSQRELAPWLTLDILKLLFLKVFSSLKNWRWPVCLLRHIWDRVVQVGNNSSGGWLIWGNLFAVKSFLPSDFNLVSLFLWVVYIILFLIMLHIKNKCLEISHTMSSGSHFRFRACIFIIKLLIFLFFLSMPCSTFKLPKCLCDKAKVPFVCNFFLQIISDQKLFFRLSYILAYKKF